MKKTVLFIVSVQVAMLLGACNFSKGVKKDLATGLSTSYNGFSVEDAYLAEGEEANKVSTNTLALGSKILIVVTGVGNYTVKDGRVFPGCTIILKDAAGKEILNLPDAFADQKDGQPEKEASTLKATLTTGDPMVVGQTYHFSAVFFDKLKKESTIATSVDVIMK
jgi:predicted small secreted protein